MAFHEKAGRSQKGPFVFSLDKTFFSPPCRHRRHPSIRTSCGILSSPYSMSYGAWFRPSCCSTHSSKPFVTCQQSLGHVPMKANLRIGILTVITLGLCFDVQLGLAFGLAALLWPTKFMPLFDILMFPWAASCRAIRANGIAAIAASLLLLVTRLACYR
jgi:hypothetical protein